MSLVLAYWIVVATIGLGAGLRALARSLQFTGRLRLQPNLPLPLDDLLRANRFEILRDGFLVGSLGVNLLIGLAAVEPSWGLSGVISLVGLVLVATLLSAYAILNYWLRTRS